MLRVQLVDCLHWRGTDKQQGQQPVKMQIVNKLKAEQIREELVNATFNRIFTLHSGYGDKKSPIRYSVINIFYSRGKQMGK